MDRAGAPREGGYSRPRSRSRSRSPPRHRRRKRVRRRPTLFDVMPDGVSDPIEPAKPANGLSANMPPERVQQQQKLLIQTRHARRVYVGNVPLSANQADLSNFISSIVSIALVMPPECADTHAIISTYLNDVKRFGFIEFNTVEVTNAALELDGAIFKGTPLRVKRPTEYDPATSPKPKYVLTWDFSKMPATFQEKLSGDASGVSADPALSYPPGSMERLRRTKIMDGPHKLYIAGFPFHVKDEQVRELLESFGKLRALHIICDKGGVKKGFAFCEYEDHGVTAAATSGLNGLDLGGNMLQVRVATTRAVAATGANMIALGDRSAADAGALPSAPLPPTRFVKLGSMVTAADISDPHEYEDIKDDVRGMAMQFGNLKNILIPKSGPSLGCVFLEYASSAGACLACNEIRGKIFDGRLVTADFVKEETYAVEGRL